MAVLVMHVPLFPIVLQDILLVPLVSIRVVINVIPVLDWLLDNVLNVLAPPIIAKPQVALVVALLVTLDMQKLPVPVLLDSVHYMVADGLQLILLA
jgi:hypothetical protein